MAGGSLCLPSMLQLLGDCAVPQPCSLLACPLAQALSSQSSAAANSSCYAVLTLGPAQISLVMHAGLHCACVKLAACQLVGPVMADSRLRLVKKKAEGAAPPKGAV